MHFGIILSDVPSTQPPREQMRDLFRIVEAAQSNGMRTIVVGQHFLYGDLRWLQPVPLLARLAAEVDPDVRLVTQVLVAPLYHPVLLAEELATLDIVTDGRLEIGLGLGYRREEFAALDVPFGSRAARFDEMLELIPSLWTETAVTHHGRFFDLDDVKPHIRPLQEPHPALWIGGNTDKGAERAGRYGDRFPVTPSTTEEEIRTRLAMVRQGFQARGKPFEPQPFRRDVLVRDDRQTAVAEFTRLAKKKYQAYAQRENPRYSSDRLERDVVEATAAVVGSPDGVIESLRRMVTTFPLDPLIFRPQFPGMTGEDTVAAIETLGQTVVTALKDVQPPEDFE